MRRQAEAQAKIFAQTMAESEARARKEMEERVRREAAEQKTKKKSENNAASNSSNSSRSQPQPKICFSVADEILKFKNLLDLGIISPEDFEKKKNELLNIPLTSISDGVEIATQTENEVKKTETTQAPNKDSITKAEPVTKVEQIYIKSIPNPADITKVTYALSSIAKLSYWDAQQTLASVPCYVEINVKENSAKNELSIAKKKLEAAGAEIEIEETELEQPSIENSVGEADKPAKVSQIYIKSIPNPADITKVTYTLTSITGLLYGEVQRILSSLPYDITSNIKANLETNKIKDILEGSGAEIEIR